MSWTTHLSDDDRRNIEQQAPAKFAALVRKALWAALLHHVNQDRANRKLPPLRQPPNGRVSDWQETLNGHVDGVITELDDRTGNYGCQGVIWVDQQFAAIKQAITGLFTDREQG